MVANDVEAVTEEKIRKGGVLVRLYFDMQDKDREKLQQLMLTLINERLMKEKGVVYCYGSIEEPLEKEGIFITSAIVTVLLDSFAPLIGLSFNYAPAGIEVLKPEKELRLKTNEVQTILMDISQISINYSKYILDRVLKPEDLAIIQKDLENRSELGKKFLKKEEGKEES